ncbi:MAG: YihY/virulence factor BrkB family protein [Clostridia bacterium]|nr:YihY/virulence factor BrkB family protein [Clostridia bacterium]
MNKTIKLFLDFYRFAKLNRVGILSGALAYFLFVSLVPFSFLLVFLSYKLGIDQRLLNGLFNGIFGSLSIAITDAVAVKKATVWLIILSIYSSTHFYFHLTSAGENIYKSEIKMGFKKRIKSFAYMLIVMFCLLCVLLINFIGKNFYELLKLPIFLTSLFNVATQMVVNLVLCFLLHRFAAPSFLRSKQLIKGWLLTFVLWECVGLFFSLYLNFSASASSSAYLARAVVFTLYLYLLMQGFVYGVIFNSYARLGGINERWPTNN